MQRTSKLVLLALVLLCASLAYRATQHRAARPGKGGDEAVPAVGAGGAQECGPELPSAARTEEPASGGREPLAQATESSATRSLLRGQVVEREGGAALAGLAIEITTPGEPSSVSATTDAEGRFEATFDGAVRLLEARVAAGPRSAARVEPLGLELGPGTVHEVLLAVSRGMRVVGRVLDPDDQPVPQAEVLGWCEPMPRGVPARRVRVDASGRFVLEHLGEEFYVEPRAEGWVAGGALAGRSGMLDSSEELILRMTPALELHLRVRTSEGELLADAQVEVAVVEPWSSAALTRSEHVFHRAPQSGKRRGTTDTRGELTLEALAALSHQITVRHPGFVEAQVRAMPGREAVEILLERGAGLFGTVVASDGRAVSDALVRLIDRRELARAHTDSEGRFELQGVELSSRGPWLAVRAEGYAALVLEPVRTSDSPLRLVLEPARALGGVLLGLDGAPASGATLRIQGHRMVSGEAQRPFHVPPTWEALVLGLYEQRTDPDGRFRFDGLHAGEYELTCVLEHEGVERRALWRVAAGATELVLRIASECFEDLVFEGRVRDALTGHPVQEFRIKVGGVLPGLEGNASSYAGEWKDVRDDDGRYRIGGVPPMRSSLFVRAPGYRESGYGFEPREAGVHRLEIDLHPVRSLTVRVLGADGSPLQDAYVTVRDAEGKSLWVPARQGAFAAGLRTDAGGRATLQNLPASQVTVEVLAPSRLHGRLPDGTAAIERAIFDLRDPLIELQDLPTSFPSTGD